MHDDPAGHYATLGVAPTAPAQTISAAFRAAARRYHPDVPGTGNAAAFIRASEAYEVLGDPVRRAAYDRSARIAEEPGPTRTAPVEVPIPPSSSWRPPTGLLLGLCAGCAGLAGLALVIFFARLETSATPAPSASYRDIAATPSSPVSPLPRSAPVEGMRQGYILPSGEPATLWHMTGPEDRFVPAGEVAAFTPVTVRRILPEHGMAEVVGSDGREGFVAASRLAPGDAREAERARCIDVAGPPPSNNEVLAHHGEGPARAVFENHRDEPVVVKLRDSAGAAAASVFVAPGAAAALDRLPPGPYHMEYAYGELWSRGCRRFVAGMRAQRLQTAEKLGTAEARYVLPPENGIDEPDEAFTRD